MSTIFGAMRIKNESRWIERVVRSILPVCERVFILDDHSTDSTDEICERIDERVTVYRSPFEGLDESRDKQWLLDRIMHSVSDIHLTGNPESPYWVLAIDGDEELVQEDIPLIRDAVQRPDVHAVSLRIVYLWNNENQWRADGVYGQFKRPSLFRLMNRGFRYQKTPFGNGANFHCSSVPQELIHHSNSPNARCEARLLHWGYIDRAHRLKKFAWYSQIDPNNTGEDCYRHMVQGDIPEIPASAKLKWAGPLELRPL